MDNNIKNIPIEKFRFATKNDLLHDNKFETKPISYFQGAFQRFCKKRFIADVYCRSRARGYFHLRTLSLRNFARVMPPALFRSSRNLLVGIMNYAPCPPSSPSRLKSGGSSSSTLVSRA